jgi:hypothetical protein
MNKDIKYLQIKLCYPIDEILENVDHLKYNIAHNHTSNVIYFTKNITKLHETLFISHKFSLLGYIINNKK